MQSDTSLDTCTLHAFSRRKKCRPKLNTYKMFAKERDGNAIVEKYFSLFWGDFSCLQWYNRLTVYIKVHQLRICNFAALKTVGGGLSAE